MKKTLTVCISMMIVSSFSTAAELTPPKSKLDVKEATNYLIYANRNPNLVYSNYDKFMDGNTPKVIAYYVFKKPNFVKVNQKYPDSYDYYVMSVKIIVKPLDFNMNKYNLIVANKILQLYTMKNMMLMVYFNMNIQVNTNVIDRCFLILIMSFANQFEAKLR